MLMLMMMMMIVKAQCQPPSVQAAIGMLMMNEVGVVDVENENDVDDYDVVDVDDKGSVSATGSWNHRMAK